MENTPPTGLYEKILTKKFREAFADLDAIRAVTSGIDPADAHIVLRQYLSGLVGSVLQSCPPSERPGRQLALVNRIVDVLAEELPSSVSSRDHATPELLQALFPAQKAGLGKSGPPPRPGIPLSQSELLINARGEYRVGREIEKEIRSADRIDLLCSFIKWSGLRLFLDAIQDFLAAGKPLRVITTVYMGATDRRALDRLVELGAEVRISFDTRRTRLHAKAWLFHRATGFSTAYIGSSNLSVAAQLDGLEWNVRVSSIDAARIVKKFEATFDTYWEDPDFTAYRATEEERRQVDRALKHEQSVKDSESPALLDIRPYPFQQEILDRLEVERSVHHRTKNLIVAATGAGKTVVAAFDYRRLCDRHGAQKLLFVAHRKEILKQSRSVFRQVLRDRSFGELYVEGLRPEQGTHVFASIQSLNHLELSSIDPHLFDVLIIDEFHHAAAPTYDRLLRHFRPSILLGLTATPERADGRSIMHWFDNHVAAELRLWDAIDRGLLVPFHYFGIHDDVDLSHVRWTRGCYDEVALTRLYTANDFRAHSIVRALGEHVPDVGHMRALGFCVGVAHAEFMAKHFRRAGIPALAITGKTPRNTRDGAIRKLQAREVNVLFAVDVFNEGVDIPEVDTVLFLRPTESATVFLQQLGRGLRLHRKKACLTVLDFIGNARREFRFDLRFRALLGITRRGVETQVKADFPLLPSGCAIQLDRESRDVILNNVRQALGLKRAPLVRELALLGPEASLVTFLHETGIDRHDLYRNGRCFSDLCRAAGFKVAPHGPDEDRLARALGRLLHVDDPDRLRFYEALLQPSFNSDTLDEKSRRRLMMLLCTLFGPKAAGELKGYHARLMAHPALCTELTMLLHVLAADVSHLPGEADLPADIPLALHASYSRDEVMAAFAHVRDGRLVQPREGVVFHEPTCCNLLFVTLQKSEQDYSPSTMYEDYAISAEHFHWQSQSTTRSRTEKGKRHSEHRERGITPLLFMRKSRKSENGTAMPYLFLGPVQYVHHKGEQPMSILWRLRTPIPAGHLRLARVAV